MTSWFRVAVHGNRTHADFTLPADVPVAALLPEIVDAMLIEDPVEYPVEHGGGMRLSRPGGEGLAADATLRAHGVVDGTVLLLSPAQDGIPAPQTGDPAERVGAEHSAQWSGPGDADCSAAVLLAAVPAATAGFLALPGAAAVPRVLLAAAAAVAVIGVGPRGGAVSVAAGMLAAAVATAAALMILTPVSLTGLCVVGQVAAVGLALSAARTAVLVTRLSRHPERTRRAHRLLAGVLGGASAIAVSAGIAGAVDSPTTATPLLGVTVAGVLLLRSRHHPDPRQRWILWAGGVIGASVAATSMAALIPQVRPGLAVIAAALAAGVLRFGGPGGLPTATAAARRALEVAEQAALVAVVPLACWACDAYAAVRGMGVA